jgi:hypothetical protein
MRIIKKEFYLFILNLISKLLTQINGDIFIYKLKFMNSRLKNFVTANIHILLEKNLKNENKFGYFLFSNN